MCTEISLGYQIYSVAKLLHQSIFLNGTLVNMETWPDCTKSRIDSLEQTEQVYLRKILNAHSKTPIEAIYLELGVVPLGFHLMKRRILYFHDIINRNENELVRRVVMAQKVETYTGDFYEQVKNNMEDLLINDEDLEESKEKFRETVEKKMKEKAFSQLIGIARTHSKTNQEMYTDCEGAAHYKDPRFTPDLANLLFKFRTRTFLVKNNFRNNYRNTNILCPICELQDDTQEHLLECFRIIEVYQREVNVKIDDIFSGDVDTLFNVAKVLKDLVEIRNSLLQNE
jgi:hypothetical protein